MKKNHHTILYRFNFGVIRRPRRIGGGRRPGMLEIFSGWLTGLFRSDTVGQESGTAYSITIENMLAEEKFAPILVVGDADDGKIWVGDYVSKEARTQFTIGNPSPLSDALGGDQSLPGKLGVGGKVTFEFKTSAKKARITAMVHPDKTPDNYVPHWWI